MSLRVDNLEHVAFQIYSGVLCYLRPNRLILGKRKEVCLIVFQGSENSLYLLLVFLCPVSTAMTYQSVSNRVRLIALALFPIF